MATTVHLPADLLEAVDMRADQLGVSRNRFIILSLQRAITEQTGWSPSFLDALEAAAKDSASRELIDDMLQAISSRRSRKSPVEL